MDSNVLRNGSLGINKSPGKVTGKAEKMRNSII